MFRILLRIYQVQFLFLLIFVACSLIAGEKNAPFWFVLITLSTPFHKYGNVFYATPQDTAT